MIPSWARPEDLLLKSEWWKRLEEELDQPYLADTSKIADLIGWQPKRQLEETVADVIEFERDRMQRARAE
jgi:nucleoside-diphosphate-sugar epimerase